ncbi:MAG TPA: hypothetical protein VMZ26_00855 [Pyrinomonadaceae bacterium]|nr:hypothetical protein [Pyrinomonadaceae bacterium]
MNELDEAWSRMLAEALANAKSSGRGDVADYLALKQSNDLIRQTGVDWLFDAFIEIASEANRQNPHLTIEREEPHEFEFKQARMAGSLIRVRSGVRSMMVEAGWTRTPAHGFMRGGALAAARIRHFGKPAADIELMLMKSDEVPGWRSVIGDSFDSTSLREHFEILLES